MSLKSIAAIAAATLTFALPAFADGMIMVDDPYARTAGKSAKTGAAFMTLMNHGAEDDQLIEARSDVAKRVELHTHKETADGVMQMMHVEEGFAIPAGGSHMLMRGGDHVMFMGLTRALEHGDTVNVTLVFEKAGEVEVSIPVDLERKPMHGKMNH
ncbi:copper chaperone PCu(A)C [uncultured Shimia sp.]|uniref:copper chaperone PCu(A)C n=1 Tax=uncultured Shimia sp. TaxID=573152 RepID=UPI00261185D0|nr:copper chaperone PCu(A)C [uncultured Shimia sp.]